jgi:hypothetical protein
MKLNGFLLTFMLGQRHGGSLCPLLYRGLWRGMKHMHHTRCMHGRSFPKAQWKLFPLLPVLHWSTIKLNWSFCLDWSTLHVMYTSAYILPFFNVVETYGLVSYGQWLAYNTWWGMIGGTSAFLSASSYIPATLLRFLSDILNNLCNALCMMPYQLWVPQNIFSYLYNLAYCFMHYTTTNQ